MAELLPTVYSCQHCFCSPIFALLCAVAYDVFTDAVSQGALKHKIITFELHQ